MRQVYIKPASPHLNGKVERSHGTDKVEFYHLIEYKNDVDLEKKFVNGKVFIITIVLTVDSKGKHL